MSADDDGDDNCPENPCDDPDDDDCPAPCTGSDCPPGEQPPPGDQTPPPPGNGAPAGAATCASGGLLDGSGAPALTDPGTLTNTDQNEDGQVSGPIHTQLEPGLAPLEPVPASEAVHEVNCDVVVSLTL